MLGVVPGCRSDAPLDDFGAAYRNDHQISDRMLRRVSIYLEQPSAGCRLDRNAAHKSCEPVRHILRILCNSCPPVQARRREPPGRRGGKRAVHPVGDQLGERTVPGRHRGHPKGHRLYRARPKVSSQADGSTTARAAAIAGRRRPGPAGPRTDGRPRRRPRPDLMLKRPRAHDHQAQPRAFGRGPVVSHPATAGHALGRVQPARRTQPRARGRLDNRPRRDHVVPDEYPVRREPDAAEQVALGAEMHTYAATSVRQARRCATAASATGAVAAREPR